MSVDTGKWKADELGLDVRALLEQALSHSDVEAALTALARDGRTVEPQRLFDAANSARTEIEQDAAAELDMLAASRARLHAVEDRLIDGLAPKAEAESGARVAELRERLDETRDALERLEAAEARLLARADHLARLARERELAATRELVDRASAEIEQSMRLIEDGEQSPLSRPPRRLRKADDARPDTSSAAITEKREELLMERGKLQGDQMRLRSTVARMSAQLALSETKHREALLRLIPDAPELSAARAEADATRERAEQSLVENGILPFLRGWLSVELDQAYERRYSQRFVLEEDDLGRENPSRLVPTDAYRATERLLTQLPGGSIGIAGARGAGKSTLIAEFCSGEWTIDGTRPTLHAVVSAPVRYEPGEFVLHLFAKLCRQARSAVAGGPDHAEIRATMRQLQRLRTITDLAVLMMLVLGVAAIGVPSGIAPPIVAGIVLLLAAGFLLTDGRPVGPLLNPWALLRTWPGLVASGLAGVAVVGIELATSGASLTSQLPTLVAGAGMAACGGFALANEPLEYEDSPSGGLGPREADHPRAFGALASFVLAAAAATLMATGIVGEVATPATLVGAGALLPFAIVPWATVTRRSTPFASFLAHGLGWAMVSAALLVVIGTTRVELGVWPSIGALLIATAVIYAVAAAATRYPFGSPPPTEERLSTPASDHGLARMADECLLKIEYLERKAAGWTTTVKAGVGSAATLGAEASRSGTTELSRLALSRPDAVDLFRRFVARATRNGPVIIGIDELDKLSDPGRAEDFLNEIKAVFGEDRCYFLISISDDAVASFERRGMPFRDVWESTLDEVVHLDPFDLALSRELLSRQLVGVSVPFAALCYVMSGGLARENIRAMRAIRDLAKTTGLDELGPLCRRLLASDLLKKRDATSTMLGALSPSVELRRWSTLLASLGEADVDQLAAHMGTLPLTASDMPTRSHEDNARFQQIVTHFLAYWYLCDTSVTFFARQFDAARMEAAEQRGPRGIEHLATARRELAISAHLAWQSVSTFRDGWGMRPLSLSTVAL